MIAASDRLRFGDVEIVRLLDGTFRVDGGAMFGVVPRTLWARRAVPDAENRITLALNCYLVRTPAATLLLDTGIGPDVSRRHADFYSVERGPGLFGGLAAMGVAPADIDVVVNSHLHFDHCGGNTLRTPEGTWAPAFPRARYAVQRGSGSRPCTPSSGTSPAISRPGSSPWKAPAGWRFSTATRRSPPASRRSSSPATPPATWGSGSLPPAGPSSTSPTRSPRRPTSTCPIS
ncbi:MAG: MBL fold metallo-hydrolase [Candidatus Moduliflexus flocculans]|nr:MBL fold metallo-hydrolase [Candidatus Moduliflexus flocculans]